MGPARSCVTGPWDRPADVALILDSSRAVLRPTSQGEEAQPARGQWSRLQHQGACPLCCLQSRLLRLGPRFPWSLEPGSHRLSRHPLQRAGDDGGSGAGKATPGGGWVLHVPSAAWQGQWLWKRKQTGPGMWHVVRGLCGAQEGAPRPVVPPVAVGVPPVLTIWITSPACPPAPKYLG